MLENRYKTVYIKAKFYQTPKQMLWFFSRAVVCVCGAVGARDAEGRSNMPYKEVFFNSFSSLDVLSLTPGGATESCAVLHWP